VLVAKWLAGQHRRIEFDGPIDGMVYGAAIGIGFAFTENNIYFLNAASFEDNLRAGFETLELREGFFNLGTLGHAIYTGLTGLGIGLAMWSRTWAGRIGWTALGLGLAMFLHAFNNGFMSFVLVAEYGYDTTANILLGGQAPVELVRQFEDTAESAILVVEIFNYAMVPVFLGLVLLFARYQQRVLRFELAEEANSGLITREDWECSTSYTQRLRCHWKLLLRGFRNRDLDQWRAYRHLHHDLGELAMLKWRLRRTGGEGTEVTRCRDKVRALRSQAAAASSAQPLQRESIAPG
jgi:hypothetical protein